jgi:hypothetical protein
MLQHNQKKLYLNIQNKNEYENQNDDFYIETINNNGTSINEPNFSNQCLFISIIDFLKKTGIGYNIDTNLTIENLRNLGGLSDNTSHDISDLSNCSIYIALQNISTIFNIRFIFYHIIRNESNKKIKYIDWQTGLPVPSDIINPNQANPNIDPSFGLEQRSIFIANFSNHFELISKIYNNNIVIYNLDEIKL